MNGKSNRSILIILFAGVLMGALDISIVGPAIPSIEEALQIPPRDLGWIFSIYVLFNLTGVSLFARLSDIYGRRSIYILSLFIFALGSLVVAISGNFTYLLVGRAVQGFGASGIFPVASAVVGDIFPREKRGRVLGLIGAVFGIAFIIGPIIAGVMLHYFKWHSLFIINLPVAIVLILASMRFIPATKVGSSGVFDWKGILSLGLMLAAFTYGVNRIEASSFLHSILSWKVMPFLILTLAMGMLTFLVEKSALNPVLKLNYFRNRQIVIAGIIAVSTGLVQSTFVFIPDFAVGEFGVSSSQASFMLVPLVFATALGSPVFGRLIDRYGSKIVINLALALTFIGFTILSVFEVTKFIFYLSGVFVGLGLSVLSGSSLRYIMLNETEAIDRAVTQGMLTIFISLGQLTGAALIGMILARYTVSDGYVHMFLFLSVMLVAVFVLSLRLKKRNEEQDMPSGIS